MSADELRRASTAEREEWGSTESRRTYPTSSAIHLALADMLDALAKRADEICDATPNAAFGERVAEQSLTGYAQCVTLARIILGDES